MGVLRLLLGNCRGGGSGFHRGLKHLGCRRNQPPMDLWVKMNAAQRREALTEWCRVEYHGKQGWVAGRYLKRDGGPGK